MHRFGLLLALACWLGLPVAARATVVSGTFAGIIEGNVRDTYGLFGAAGADLSGAVLHASYSYDTAAAFSYMPQSGSDTYLGTDNLTLSVSIGGVTVSTGTVTGSEVTDTADGPRTAVTLANFAPTPLIAFELFALGAWVPDATINTAFTLDPDNYGQTIYVSADGTHYDALEFDATPVPAPAAGSLFAGALAALAGLRHRRGPRRPRHHTSA